MNNYKTLIIAIATLIILLTISTIDTTPTTYSYANHSYTLMEDNAVIELCSSTASFIQLRGHGANQYEHLGSDYQMTWSPNETCLVWNK